MKIGIIGSAGVNTKLLTEEYIFENITVEGELVKYYRGFYEGNEIFLFARNLYSGAVPPHKVKYYHIMRAFKELKVDMVLATAFTGSLRKEYKPGDFVVLDQFIDMTKHTMFTAFTGDEFAFVDFTEPYCPSMRKLLIRACEKTGIIYHEKGCYVGVDGPRFETSAEVKFYGLIGGDVVGMTNVSEAIMAREMGICYAAISVITNYGAGMDKEEILRRDCYDQTMELVDSTVKVIQEFMKLVPEKELCKCAGKISDMVTG